MSLVLLKKRRIQQIFYGLENSLQNCLKGFDSLCVLNYLRSQTLTAKEFQEQESAFYYTFNSLKSVQFICARNSMVRVPGLYPVSLGFESLGAYHALTYRLQYVLSILCGVWFTRLVATQQTLVQIQQDSPNDLEFQYEIQSQEYEQCHIVLSRKTLDD